MLNISLLALKYMSLMTAELSKNTTSRPLTSSTSTRCIFGSYMVRFLPPLNIATVISGSLFFLPSVDFPDNVQDISFDSLPSLFHLNAILGVISEAAGSLWLRSKVEAEGSLNVFCGISNSQCAELFHDPGICLTVTC